jgi:hypothetical protein
MRPATSVEEQMKPLWDLFKEVGWIGVIGIFFLVSGMALGFGLSPKDFLELNSAAWTMEKKVAVILGAAGILIVVAALVAEQASSIAKQIVLDSRQKVYGDAARTVRRHKALSYDDTPILVSRVIRSAHEFEQEMRAMSIRPGLEESSRDFLEGTAQLAKAFYLSVEHTEYMEKLNLAKEDRTKDDLSEQDYSYFTAKRLEWVERTQLLFQGAASMLGVKPPDFNW